ncbi:glycosyltransferase [Ginsengibacter hankyongi]|uniref:Glycosyltransferase n=1 Tax=Ginsengibacter hankyongi TaxID=2607284 RepID=A0A5J5IM96_9BACT|nr:glycosyltransferase [Ginsengibacter hankyongi]KAA9042059.1 glycosyltransferase [Ginsengibacter hankyongi]
MILLLISLLLLLPYVMLIIYYRQSWLELKEYNVPEDQIRKNATLISVIISARNEEKNIGSCIASIIKQTYPANLFEVLIVDDYSVDSTAAIANSFNQKNIRLIKLSDFTANVNLNSYKKKAIETAIDLAKGNLIVTTDADCIVKPEWLKTIASYYEESGAVFIAAPVVYANVSATESISKKFFKIFQSLDFMALQGITGASVYKRIHNMCNGANLAYEKKVFYEVNGFEGIDNIASGDDMLLMHKIQKIYPGKIRYLKSANVIVQTQQSETVKDFINQRIRWASKADRYPDIKITAVLFLVYFLNAWICFIAVYSIFCAEDYYLLLLLVTVKTAVEVFFLFPVTKFFDKQKLLWWFIPSQPFHIIYTLIAGWLGKFGSYTWKERKVK